MGSILKEEGVSRVLIGKDTRISGYMFESALQAGFISAGMDVTFTRPLPTPVSHTLQTLIIIVW